MDREIEGIVEALINGDPPPIEDFVPKSRSEEYLKSALMTTKIEDLPNPQSRLDVLICALHDNVHNAYSENFESGYSEGYDDGLAVNYDVGYSAGYEAGNADGEAIGNENGRKEGYISGHADGYTEGFTSGRETGNTEGYEEGHEAGIEVGKQAEYDRFWDNFQNYGKRKNYRHAFSGAGWTNDTLKPKYPIVFDGSQSQQCGSMFAFLNRYAETEPYIDLEHITKMIDFSKCTWADSTFANANIKNIYADLSNCTRLYLTFSNADGVMALDNVYIKVSEKCTSYSSTFNYAYNLTTIRFLEGSVIAATISFAQCTKLTVESTLSIIEALKNYAGTDSEGAYTLTFPSAVWDRLEASGITPPSENTWKDYVYSKGWLYA